MDFNAPIFLFLFLPIFLILYYLVPFRAKLLVGIVGSLFFYGYGNSKYIFLMLSLTCITYFWAKGMAYWHGQYIGKVLLWVGVLSNVALLVGFKLVKDIQYPLGLSYITFQVIAYLFEVHKNAAEVERDFLKFSFYLLLFPKILVGPITRYSNLKMQINELHINTVDAADGVRRFILGFAKKALIADTLGKVVTPIFNLSSPSISPAVAWIVICSYSIQLYFDFSGYTDMAIGIGKMMGMKFIENFNFPYISKSIGDFWRRWHISLSNWFRDFVFFPLERQRLNQTGQAINIMIVFLLTGLWHGLSMTFITWGFIHGLALVFEATDVGKKMRTMWSPLQHLYALLIILTGWVFFRSPSMGYAIMFLRRLIGDQTGIQALPFELTNPLPILDTTVIIAIVAGVLFSFPLGQWGDRYYQALITRVGQLKYILPVIYDIVLFFLFTASIAATTSTQFIPGIYGAF